MAKFLITGSKGQIGHCLLKQLQGKVELLATDRLELDITDRNAVFKKIRDFKPDIVINAAAYTAVDLAESEVLQARLVNVDGARNIAEAAQEIGAIMFHISTDYVFDGNSHTNYLENDNAMPLNAYGLSKLDGEKAVLEVNSRSIILRTAWAFSEYGNNFVKTMLRLGKEHNSLSIVVDQIGGPTYASDIAAALIHISNSILNGHGHFGIYHFTGKPYVSWFEFANMIFAEAVSQNVLEKSPLVNAITTSDYPTPAKRPANSRLDLAKIKNVFDIEPSDWQGALKNIKAYI